MEPYDFKFNDKIKNLILDFDLANFNLVLFLKGGKRGRKFGRNPLPEIFPELFFFFSWLLLDSHNFQLTSRNFF